MTTFVNLTPHPITVIRADSGDRVQIPASGRVARVVSKNESSETVYIDGIAITYTNPGNTSIEGIPDPQADTIYIVSGIVLNALRSQNHSRRDVVSPGTGPKDGAIRDEQGNITAITRFIGIL